MVSKKEAADYRRGMRFKFKNRSNDSIRYTLFPSIKKRIKYLSALKGVSYYLFKEQLKVVKAMMRERNIEFEKPKKRVTTTKKTVVRKRKK